MLTSLSICNRTSAAPYARKPPATASIRSDNARKNIPAEAIPLYPTLFPILLPLRERPLTNKYVEKCKRIFLPIFGFH